MFNTVKPVGSRCSRLWRSHVLEHSGRTGEAAVVLPRPRGQHQGRRPMQTAVLAVLLWACRRVSIHQGVKRCCRAIRRRQEHGAIREGRHRQDRPRRVSGDRLRPEGDLYGEILRIYFSVAHDRPARRQGRRRDAIPVGDFLRRRVAAAHRAGLHSQLEKARAFARPS